MNFRVPFGRLIFAFRHNEYLTPPSPNLGLVCWIIQDSEYLSGLFSSGRLLAWQSSWLS